VAAGPWFGNFRWKSWNTEVRVTIVVPGFTYCKLHHTNTVVVVL
jgi:hypothetical protein